MGVVSARLAFLAFLGLTGAIIYNALYLQEGHGTAMNPNPASTHVSVSDPPVVVPLPTPSPQAATSDVRKDVLAQSDPVELVRDIQTELKARGYNAGQANGRMRDDTKAAISAYEKVEGLPVTGKPSDQLLARLLMGQPSKTAATTGSVAPAPQAPRTVVIDHTIKSVQQVLADLGYDPGSADGAMGASTKTAIEAFQKDRKIAQDGRITPSLLREIKRVTGKSIE
jgi:peptidoglycan hydrolase-like protein with peptidoglycan-binding domain